MRYMLLLYDNDDTRDAFFGPGSEPLGEEMDALLKELRDSGELVATDPLADPAQTRTVRVSGGAPALGPGATPLRLRVRSQTSSLRWLGIPASRARTSLSR